MKLDPRLPITFAGLLLVFAGAVFRPPDIQGRQDFTRWKSIDPTPVEDVVILGDSRAESAIDAPLLTRETGLQSRNFAFAGLGYTEEYFRAARSMLKPDGRRVVVLTITPRSLGSAAQEENAFERAASTQSWERWVLSQQPSWADRFKPYRLEEMREFLRSARTLRVQTQRDRSPQAWERIRSRVINRYRQGYENSPVDARVAASLLGQVTEWRRDGVQVYGFYPSGAPALVELEKEAFDLPSFIQEFRTAGGTWIEMPNVPIEARDGVHVEASTTRAFTEHLGRALRRAPTQ